jgi:hypothetical protein
MVTSGKKYETFLTDYVKFFVVKDLKVHTTQQNSYLHLKTGAEPAPET